MSRLAQWAPGTRFGWPDGRDIIFLPHLSVPPGRTMTRYAPVPVRVRSKAASRTPAAQRRRVMFGEVKKKTASNSLGAPEAPDLQPGGTVAWWKGGSAGGGLGNMHRVKGIAINRSRPFAMSCVTGRWMRWLARLDTAISPPKVF